MVTYSTDLVLSLFTNNAFLSGMETNYIGLSQDTRFAMEALNIPEAILIIVAAFALRFTIKLIPFI